MSDQNRDVPFDRRVLWRQMRKLLDRLLTATDRETFLDDALDNLVDVLGADRGLILLSDEQGASFPVNARGNNRALTPFEREEVSKTIIRAARGEGECVVWEAAQDSGPSHSIAELRIATAVAAPLRVPAWKGGDTDDTALVSGVLYLDFRDIRREVGDLERELVTAAADLLSTVVAQQWQIRAAQESLRHEKAKASLPGTSLSLEQLLQAPSMRALRREVQSCIHGDSSVLIEGESGTGKTLLAMALAEASGRKPVVRAMLGASDDLNTIASELFGHERGSFSGAVSKRVGLVELADGGTLIFDEILNLPPGAQQLLLDFTQFGTYRPLGYDRRDPKRAQVRLIAATNGDLHGAIREGRFREDLYYRLAAARIEMPPLRDRRDEVPSLAEGILARLDGTRHWRISVPLRRLLLANENRWPGNLRQLEAVIRRARERARAEDPDADTLTPDHVDARDLGRDRISIPPPQAVSDPSLPLCSAFQVEEEELGDSWERLQKERSTLDAFERRIIEACLRVHGGVVASAARELGLGRTSLLSRMDTLGIERPKKR